MTETTGLIRAWQLGIEKLYHYEEFNPDYLSAMLKDRRIHCSDPAKLNDPWDCKPSFDPKSMYDPEIFSKVMKWYHAQVQGPPQPDVARALETKLSAEPDYMKLFLDDLSESFHQMIFKRKIYCLTPDAKCSLMWSHYTNKHRGLCFEFSTATLMFRNALKVVYKPEYQNWLLYLVDPEKSIEMVLTKSDEWEYENEFRLWTVAEDRPSPYLRPEGNFLALPEGALTAVIVGCDADYDAIKAIVDTHMPALPVKRIVRIPHHYRLTIEGE
jgi:hypothetical protein